MEEIEKTHNQGDVNPTTQQDKILQIKEEEHNEGPIPSTNGTGSNHPLPTSGTVIVKEENGSEREVKNNREKL